MSAAPRRPLLPATLAVFLLFQGLYAATASGRVDRVPDEFEVYLQVESLWERGGLAIPQVPDGAFFGRVGRGGLPYAPYGPGVAFFALPHHALGRAAALALGLPRETPAWTIFVAAVTSLAASTWAALAVAGTFRAARALGAAPTRAFLVAGLLGGATYLWPYGGVFYSEPLAAALLVWGLVAHLTGRGWAGGLALGLAVLAKPTHVVFAPAFLALAALGRPGEERPRGALALLEALNPWLAGVALAGLAHLGWNTWRFGLGAPFEFGYDWHEFIPRDEQPRPFALEALPRGLFGLLLSPGKSLLLFAPPLLLAGARARPFLRQARPVAVCAGVALASGLLFFAPYMYWEGGYSFGPRHLLPLLPLPLLALTAGPPPRRGLLLAVAAAGVVVAGLGTSVSFLEDQALGVPPTNERYYRIAPAEVVGRGRPRNLYRLDYAPWRSYPRILARRAGPGEPPGLGFQNTARYLGLVRERVPTGERIPAWVPPIFPLAGLVLAGLGLLGRPWRSSLEVAPEEPGSGSDPCHDTNPERTPPLGSG